MISLAGFIVIVWILFWVYWFASAVNSKRNVYNGRGVSIGIGLRLGFIVILVLLTHANHTQSFWANVFNGHSFITHNVLLETIGTVVFLASLLFAVWARLHLGKNWGMPMSQKQEPELITSGPYHFVRHPIYTGILLASVGTAIATGVGGFVVCIFLAAYFIFSAYQEEKYLTKQFGKRYTTYKKSTKMLLPFIF